MATQEDPTAMLIGQGDSDSDIGRPREPARLHSAGRRATDALARLRARAWPATTPREDGAPEYPSTDVWRPLAPAGGAAVPLQRAGLAHPGTAGPPHHERPRPERGPSCSTVRATAHVNTMHGPRVGRALHYCGYGPAAARLGLLLVGLPDLDGAPRTVSVRVSHVLRIGAGTVRAPYAEEFGTRIQAFDTDSEGPPSSDPSSAAG